MLVAAGLMLIMRYIRHVVTHWDDTIEDREKEWVNNTIEAENDVVALMLSLLLVQFVRFVITGKMPDAEGHEEAEVLTTRSHSDVVTLFTMGIACALVAFVLLVLG